jgi:hypothetical protein
VRFRPATRSSLIRSTVRMPSIAHGTARHLIDHQSCSCQFRSKCNGISKHYAEHTQFNGRVDVFTAVVNVDSVARLDSKSIEENFKNTPVWLQQLHFPRKQYPVKPPQAFESIHCNREGFRRPVAEGIDRYAPRPQCFENIDCARNLASEHFLVSLKPSVN